MFVSLWEKAASALFCPRGSQATQRGVHRLQPQVLTGETEYGTRPRAARPCVHQTHSLRAWGQLLCPRAPRKWHLGWGGTAQLAWWLLARGHTAARRPQPEAPAHTLTRLWFYFRPSRTLSTVQQICTLTKKEEG